MEIFVEDADLFAPPLIGEQNLYPNGPSGEPDEDDEAGPLCDPRFEPTD